jgi:ketosteroid isomerase-like protein
MEKDQYKQLAQLVFTCFNNRDFGPVQNSLAENVVLNFPGVGDISGKRRTILFFKTLLRKYPELTFTVSEIMMENKRAVAVWSNQGKSSDGKGYSNSGITLFHFEEEKIVFISDYFKDTSFVG